MSGPTRVLHVTADPQLAAQVRDHVGRHGAFQLTEAGTEAAWSASWRDGSFDLILVDRRAGTLRAEAVIAAACTALPPVPVVILTAGGSEEVAARLMRHGAVDYLSASSPRLLKLPRLLRAIVALHRERAARNRPADPSADGLAQEYIAHFRAIFDHAPMGIALVDVGGHPVVTNRAIQEILGYDAAALRGKTFTDFTHPDDAPGDLALFEEMIAGARDSYFLEKRYIHRDGHEVWASLAAAATRDTHGSLTGAIGMVHDITARKGAEHEIERAQHAFDALAGQRSDFVAAVSHELRTPLTMIIGYTELLQSRWRQLDDVKRLRWVERIAAAAARQHQMVGNLLLLNQLEMEMSALRAEAVSLFDLAHQALDTVQRTYDHEPIATKGPADLYALADPDRAQQTVSALVDNAAKYSPPGTPIDISWVQEAEMVVLRVQDRGPGIAEADRGLLFTCFGRVPGSQMRDGHVGTGLGLYLGRCFAEAMGGALDLEDSGPGGSTFRLRLPHAP